MKTSVNTFYLNEMGNKNEIYLKLFPRDFRAFFAAQRGGLKFNAGLSADRLLAKLDSSEVKCRDGNLKIR
jgi:hypothetical protein